MHIRSHALLVTRVAQSHGRGWGDPGTSLMSRPHSRARFTTQNNARGTQCHAEVSKDFPPCAAVSPSLLFIEGAEPPRSAVLRKPTPQAFLSLFFCIHLF